MEAIMQGESRRAFVPIAGLHHAARDRAAGFCVFNDCGVAIELLKRAGLKRVGYVDIDAHHGDGVFYAFEEDAAVVFADLHEDGRYLYPGSGALEERGRSEEHTSELQSQSNLVCRLLLEKKKQTPRHRAPPRASSTTAHGCTTAVRSGA